VAASAVLAAPKRRHGDNYTFARTVSNDAVFRKLKNSYFLGNYYFSPSTLAYIVLARGMDLPHHRKKNRASR